MDKQLVQAMNDQIKNEWYSAYLYLSMAAYFESKNLEGFAHWMDVQAKEEYAHGKKFYDFLHDRGERVVLKAIDQPPSDFASPLDVFEKALAHEQHVTSLINNLYDMAQKTKDNPSLVFLQWFITEQVEEEKNASQIVDRLKLLKPDTAALFMLDAVLAKREE